MSTTTATVQNAAAISHVTSADLAAAVAKVDAIAALGAVRTLAVYDKIVFAA